MSSAEGIRVGFVCKRFYTGKDLIEDRYGRLFHIPVGLGLASHEVLVLAADYKKGPSQRLDMGRTRFESIAWTPRHPLFPAEVHRRLRSFSPDVVLASADTHLGWVGLRTARRLGVPFVFDVYDNYTSFASARIPGMRRLFRRVAAHADVVTVVTQALCDLVGDSSRCRLVPNGVDLTLFRPVDKQVARQAIGIKEEPVVIGYVGAVAPHRGLETLIGAVGKLAENSPEIVLLLAGQGKLSEGMNQPWVEHRGDLPHNLIPSLIGACDVVVLPYLNDEWGRYTSPNKLFEYLACQVPIVMTDVADNSRYVTDRAALCRPGDPIDMARAIEHQLVARVAWLHPEALSWEGRSELVDEVLRNLVST